MIKTYRIGEINKNSNGTFMKIIDYTNANNIIVEFQDDYKYKVHCAYREFKKGKVRNPFDKTIYSAGYIGIGNYKVKENGTLTNPYKYWQSMLRRCFSEEYDSKQPTYVLCEVDSKWLCYQNFAQWFYEKFIKLKMNEWN